MKRIVKTPIATPISTNSVPSTPSAARGRTRRWCGKIEWVTALETICWRTAPALPKSKRAMADLRGTATSYRTATANKVSRRNPTSHSKVRIKGPGNRPRLRVPRRAPDQICCLSDPGRNPPRLFIPACPNATLRGRRRLTGWFARGVAFRSNFHGYRDSQIVRPWPRSSDP